MDSAVDKIYDGLETDAEREEAYEKFVYANLKRNYAGHYLHGMLGMTGFRLVNAPTFMPAYLHLICGAPWLVGLGQQRSEQVPRGPLPHPERLTSL